MTEPNSLAVPMDAATIRTFIGQRVRVMRDGRQEGVGELVDVLAGEFDIYDPEHEDANSEGVRTVQVDDKSIRWIDDQAGDFTTHRRYSNRWSVIVTE